MYLQTIVLLLAFANFTSAIISTETLTPQTPLTATGATVVATGVTVTFTLELTTATVSIGSGTTVTLNASSLSVSTTTASVSSPTGSSLPAVPSSPITNSTCTGVYADPDIIGLGVRLGLYLQLFSNILVVYKSPDEAVNSIVQTNMFMTAVFVAIMYSVAQGRATPGELIVFMWLTALELCPYAAIVLILKEMDKRDPVVRIFDKRDRVELNFWTRHMITLRAAAFTAFYVWFWFHGLTIPNPLQCREPRVFFFANLGAYGNIRTVFKVIAIFGAIAALATIIRVVYAIPREIAERIQRGIQRGIQRWTKINEQRPLAAEQTSQSFLFARMRRLYNSSADFRREMIKLYTQFQGIPHNLVDFAKDNVKYLPAKQFIARAGAASLTLVSVVTAMELEIKWNDFKNLYDLSQSGQIIPLTIGACAFVRAVLLLIGFLEGEREKEETEGANEED
jgi:hypothetical protein